MAQTKAGRLTTQGAWLMQAMLRIAPSITHRDKARALCCCAPGGISTVYASHGPKTAQYLRAG